MPWYRFVLAVVAAYLIGAIPIGYIVIYAMKKQDIRRHGSGRTGGTNAIRAGGSLAGLLTGIGDILKGMLAVLVARWLTGDALWGVVLAGTAALIGNNWSPYISFKGGAGAATNVGICIALWPLSILWLVPLLPFGLNVIGYASVTSLIIAGVIPLTLAIRAALGAGPWLHVVYGVLAALVIVWALRPNIKRLLNGTEPRAPKLEV
jgi:acyl phosphate:glycerol-3-phosphate acyltransferase